MSTDIANFFTSCRTGDINRAQYLVEKRGVPMNLRDNWDSTPLYYACLCGHADLVKYLLDQGAKCEQNTFDGERCIYGALNDEVRRILVSYKAVTKSTIRRDIYTEFLRRLFERNRYSDFTFIVDNEEIRAHKCILCVRSSYFANMFETKWKDRNCVNISHPMVNPKIFRALLAYIYTSTLEIQFSHLEDLKVLAKNCHLDDFIEEIDDKMNTIHNFGVQKPGFNVTTLVLEPEDTKHTAQSTMSLLADLSLPNDLCYYEELPFPDYEEQILPDIIFSVEGHYFKCHKAFFLERSAYFVALFDDHFGELYTDDEFPVISLSDISTDVFTQIVHYIYCEKPEELTSSNVLDVMIAADMYLLPGLKTICASTLSQLLCLDNIMQSLRLARMFQLTQFEDNCVEFISRHIEAVVTMPEFIEIVKEDAHNIANREETDSIPIIDDIRFHLTCFINKFSEVYEVDQKMHLINNLLEDLGLDG